jgi:hypothetical protein
VSLPGNRSTKKSAIFFLAGLPFRDAWAERLAVFRFAFLAVPGGRPLAVFLARLRLCDKPTDRLPVFRFAFLIPQLLKSSRRRDRRRYLAQ